MSLTKAERSIWLIMAKGKVTKMVPLKWLNEVFREGAMIPCSTAFLSQLGYEGCEGNESPDEKEKPVERVKTTLEVFANDKERKALDIVN